MSRYEDMVTTIKNQCSDDTIHLVNYHTWHKDLSKGIRAYTDPILRLDVLFDRERDEMNAMLDFIVPQTNHQEKGAHIIETLQRYRRQEQRKDPGCMSDAKIQDTWKRVIERTMYQMERENLFDDATKPAVQNVERHSEDGGVTFLNEDLGRKGL